MKTDRLLGILTVLLRQDKTTARELAQKFEVSKRTIVRDVQALCLAGFSVLTEQGAGGGISLMEGFTLDRTLLTAKELRAVLTGLKSLDSVSGDNKYRTLMQKLGASAPETLAAGEHVLIDLSSYYKQSLAPKISLLQAAMENSYRVRFSYLNRGGESERVVEPYYLISGLPGISTPIAKRGKGTVCLNSTAWTRSLFSPNGSSRARPRRPI